MKNKSSFICTVTAMPTIYTKYTYKLNLGFCTENCSV